ncbi:MAG: hypothetical protein IJ071_05890 [Ruminococcus sp.]|nr:hypothetical protein [Ruminococcus sp.]
MKKHIAILTVILTLTCAFASCGDNGRSSSSESTSESSAETVSESSEESEDPDETGEEASGYETSEEAIKAFYDCIAQEDYDGALSVKMPKKIRNLIWYTISEESGGKRSVDWDEELLDDHFGYWDYYQKPVFKEILSEEPGDDDDLAYINAELCCVERAADAFDELPEPEELEEKMDQIYDELVDDYTGLLKSDAELGSYQASEMKSSKVLLSDSHGVELYHTVLTYYVDGEGWFVLGADEEDKDDWQDGIVGLSDLGDGIYRATADVLNGFFAENKFGLADEDWVTTVRVLSPDQEKCYNFDPEAAKAACDGIAEAVEGLDGVDYFLVIVGNETENIVISRKEKHNIVMIYPHGSIDFSDDDYVNASDLSFEQAYEVYMEKIKSE